MRTFMMSLSRGLARAAEDLIVAAHVHKAYGDQPPTFTDGVYYWCHGFRLGFTGDADRLKKQSDFSRLGLLRFKLRGRQ